MRVVEPGFLSDLTTYPMVKDDGIINMLPIHGLNRLGSQMPIYPILQKTAFQ